MTKLTHTAVFPKVLQRQSVPYVCKVFDYYYFIIIIIIIILYYATEAAQTQYNHTQ